MAKKSRRKTSKSKVRRKRAAKRKVPLRRKKPTRSRLRQSKPRQSKPRVGKRSPARIAPTRGHLFAVVLDRVKAASSAVLTKDIDLSRIVVEPPKDPTHGDMATNVAMVLAKELGKKPRDLAEQIAVMLTLHCSDLVDRVEVAGPGFINLTLKPQVWRDELRRVLGAGRDYGRSDLGRGEKVNVEYVSANPTGPMHVGHGAARCSAMRLLICSPSPAMR